MHDDVQRFRSLMDDTEMTYGMLPKPDKLPTDFFEFISNHHELKLGKYVGCSKSSWDTNLWIRFSR